ncbi:MAG TPA: nuclear transport factor 2 family protein [Anaeromyxobacter sp.]
MTLRTTLLVLAALAAVACSPRRIPGTEIRSTADSRAVYDVVQAYRQAMEKKDAAAVLALVAPNYYDTAGTPDPSDDLDRARLETSLPQTLASAESVKLDFTIRKIDVEGDDAQAEVFYDAFYRVTTPAVTVPRRDSDVHRIRFHKVQGAWKIVAGL